MKRVIAIVLMLTLLTTFAACGTKTATSADNSSSTNKTETKASDKTENKAPDKTETKASDAAMGQWNKIDKTVTVDDVKYTINAYKKSKKSTMFTAKDGQTYLLIDITVKNTTAEEAAVSSLLTFELTDSDGKTYDVSLGGLAGLEGEKLEQLDGSVPASSELKGGIAYEIPENAKGVKISVKELIGDGKQTVDLY